MYNLTKLRIQALYYFKKEDTEMAQWIMDNWAAIVAFFDKLFGSLVEIAG